MTQDALHSSKRAAEEGIAAATVSSLSVTQCPENSFGATAVPVIEAKDLCEEDDSEQPI